MGNYNIDGKSLRNTIQKRFGYDPTDKEYFGVMTKLMEDPNYGLKKSDQNNTGNNKQEKKAKKATDVDPIQKALDDAEKRQKKYTGGVGNWFN